MLLPVQPALVSGRGGRFRCNAGRAGGVLRSAQWLCSGRYVGYLGMNEFARSAIRLMLWRMYATFCWSVLLMLF